ncbi:hypothetical protein RIVM261_035920 [Rivularia sp. IAM M-261]|nr:hypothetical protein RIVM261_035920 [Rivularia sp. IAM M-261]
MNINQDKSQTSELKSEEINQTAPEAKNILQTLSSWLKKFITVFKPNSLSKPVDNATYPDKTDRIRAISDLIKSVSSFIWLGVVFIIIFQLWGNYSLHNISHSSKPNTVTITISEQKRSQISADVAAALGKALVSARASASKNLEQWDTEVMERVDHPFLDWYYNYFNQLGMGVKAIWANLSSAYERGKAIRVNFSSTYVQNKAEKLIGDFQKEFAKQVFQPSLMQLQMERFTREAIETYVSQANQNLAGVQSKYEIPQPAWEKFLEGLGNTTYNAGGKEQNTSGRALLGARSYIATAAIMKGASVIAPKIAAKTVSKAASKAVTKIATKTATKAAAEGTGEMAVGLLGLKLLNPIAGLGVLAWDVWDHYHTVKVERPILRESLEKYLDEVKDSLLNDTENGILSSVNKFHDGIMDSLSHKPVITHQSKPYNHPMPK